jgi:hypothetical protein
MKKILVSLLVITLSLAVFFYQLPRVEAAVAITSKFLDTSESGPISTYTTASTLTASNNLLYIAIVSAKSTSGWNTGTPALTGAGITWVAIGTIATTGTQSNSLMYRGLVTSGATTQALTFTPASPDTFLYPRIEVFEVSGMDTSGTNGSGAVLQTVDLTQTTGTATPSVSITMTTGTALISMFHTGNNITALPRASWTESRDSGTGNGSLETQYFIGTDTACSATWASSQSGTAHCTEIKPAAAASATGPKVVVRGFLIVNRFTTVK